MKRLLITGATGFVGQHLVQYLNQEKQYRLRLVHRGSEQVSNANEIVKISDITTSNDWTDALDGCDVVIHLAALVHQMHKDGPIELQKYRRINVDATLALARKAASQGVKRFIFVSSIKVNGEFSLPHRPFRADDVPRPKGSYAISKYEAEQGLLSLSKALGLEVVIIRPTLVYGPGTKGNFPRLISLIQKGIPLPFRAFSNQRSYVSVYNLIDLITECIENPMASQQTFLVSDGLDHSLPALLHQIGRLIGKKPRLFSIPLNFLMRLGHLLNRQEEIEKIAGALQVDIQATCERLNWTPKFSMEETLKKTLHHLEQSHS